MTRTSSSKLCARNADTGTISLNTWVSCSFCSSANSWASSLIVSLLLITAITGTPKFCTLANTSSSSSTHFRLSITNNTASTSAKAEVAALFIRSLIARTSRLWIPGVSTKIACNCSLVKIPIMRWRVVWGFREVIDNFWPNTWFINVDLPTFGRPTMAT